MNITSRGINVLFYEVLLHRSYLWNTLHEIIALNMGGDIVFCLAFGTACVTVHYCCCGYFQLLLIVVVVVVTVAVVVIVVHC